MNVGGRTQGSLGARPVQQVRAVWIALAAVLLTLSLLFIAYGWRAYDFTAKRALNQSQNRAELTRSQVFNAFRHMDDILLQTKSVFERMGPGIAGQTGLLMQSGAPVGLAPYSCIGIVNALGDAFLRIPENCVLPDISSQSSRFQPMGGSNSRLFTDAFEGAQGPSIVRAVRLFYADETFAGMVVAVLSSDYVFSVFRGLDTENYRVSLVLSGEPQGRNIALWGGSRAFSTLGEANAMLEFEGFTGPLRLDIQSSASRSAALIDWRESVMWPFLGYLLVVFWLLKGARVLTHALRQQLASDLQVQRARIESEVQTRFIANISHEVRTPMNGVLGASRLLGKTSLTEHQRQLLGLVERSGKVLLNTINDLLDIGKLREGQMTLEHLPVDLIHVLEDSCALQAPQAFAKGLDLVVTLDLPEQLRVMGDALRIQQVVTNLVNNAVKFTSHGRVCVSASLKSSTAGSRVQIQVIDTGIGIDLSRAGWLFQPFQQADASTARRFGGTGLGLAITDQLVRLMGGVLEVESQLGLGTSFKASWPSTSSPEPLEPASRSVPKHFVCTLALSDTEVGRLEHRALSCHLLHLGIPVHDMVSGPPTTSTVVVTDEDLVSSNRIAGLRDTSTLLILCREPATFRVPGYLRGRRCVPIGRPARRAELLQGLLRGGEQDFCQLPEPASQMNYPVEARPLTGLHVLVAEDHAVNQILIRHMLQAAGSRVHLVPHGLAALEVLFGAEASQTGPFDLVLMDCQMPELDGFAATAQIRRHEKLANTGHRLPIIALTALAMSEDALRCIESGMDDYCSKPIDERVLMSKINHWARRKPQTKKRS